MGNKIETFKNLITFVSPGHMGLKGGTKARRDLISATAEELRIFLQGYRGKHISKEELKGFYDKNFPLLNLRIKNENPASFFDKVCGGTEAETEILLSNDLNNVDGFEITLYSKSIMDKIKSLLRIKNNKKDFYVNSSFVNSTVHEGTHVMQEYLKPTEQIFRKSIIKKSIDGEQYIDTIMDHQIAYYGNVYNMQTPLFCSYLWIKKLMHKIKQCKFSHNKEAVPDSLKFCIRRAQQEKEAYALGEREGIKFMLPNIAKTSIGNKILDLFPHITFVHPLFRFRSKIRAMKKEYFKLIEGERKQI